jgi:hypothetical protein
MADYTSLHHPISRNPHRLPKCCICSNPVCLETSKTDEYGQALHEECYVLKLCLKQEWHVLKLWLKPDFLTAGVTCAGPRETGSRSATLARRRWHRSGSLQYQNARRVCDILIQRAKRVSCQAWQWQLELAAVVAVLLLTCWIASGDGHPPSFLGSSGLHTSTALQEQGLVPTKAAAGKGRSRPQTALVSVEEASTANPFQRVENVENEVVQIGDDVTVRYFTTTSIRNASDSNREVSSRSVGKDVTVRYFTPRVRSTRN